jgi:hypothetical protein
MVVPILAISRKKRAFVNPSSHDHGTSGGRYPEAPHALGRAATSQLGQSNAARPQTRGVPNLCFRCQVASAGGDFLVCRGETVNILSKLYYRYKKILKTIRLYLIIEVPASASVSTTHCMCSNCSRSLVCSRQLQLSLWCWDAHW